MVHQKNKCSTNTFVIWKIAVHNAIAQPISPMSYRLGENAQRNHDGKSDGKYDGKSDGKSDGKHDGKRDGKNGGKRNGKNDGKRNGKNDGKHDGKNERKNEYVSKLQIG